METIIPWPDSKFVKVECSCKNQQIIFGKASTDVKCLVCNKVLASSTGGKAIIKGKVVEVL